jgi:hypothetical protein
MRSGRPQETKMADSTYPVYGEITGPIVMIGFGSIGRGTLPLIERHFKYDRNRLIVIEPREDAADAEIYARHGVRHIKSHVTKDNYKDLLKPLLQEGGGQAFCVNLSVDTGSVDLMRLCRKHDALYIDTVIEPWLGFYFDKSMKNADRTNYALRETLRREKEKNPGGATAVSTCGANPRQPRQRPRPEVRGALAGGSRRLGEADEEGRRQGRSHRGARHAAHEEPEALQHLLEHLVRGRLHLGRAAAGRTRLGHP